MNKEEVIKKFKEKIIKILEESIEIEYTDDICGNGCCGGGYYDVIKNPNEIINNIKNLK